LHSIKIYKQRGKFGPSFILLYSFYSVLLSYFIRFIQQLWQALLLSSVLANAATEMVFVLMPHPLAIVSQVGAAQIVQYLNAKFTFYFIFKWCAVSLGWISDLFRLSITISDFRF
jgi:hypothetical protein